MDRCLEYVQFQGTSVMSRLITSFTRDFDSHSAVLDREKLGTSQLIEQWPHKGLLKAWMDYNDFSNHTKGTPYTIWSLPVSQLQYDEVMNYYRRSAELKKAYDWQGLFSFLSKGPGDDSKTFCSEEMILPLCIVMGWDTINPTVVYPGMFRMLLQAAGAYKSYEGFC